MSSPYAHLSRVTNTWVEEAVVRKSEYGLGTLFTIEHLNLDPIWAGSYNRGNKLSLIKIEKGLSNYLIEATFVNLTTGNMAKCYDLDREIRAGNLSIKEGRKKENLPKLTLKDLLQEEEEQSDI